MGGSPPSIELSFSEYWTSDRIDKYINSFLTYSDEFFNQTGVEWNKIVKDGNEETSYMQTSPLSVVAYGCKDNIERLLTVCEKYPENNLKSHLLYPLGILIPEQQSNGIFFDTIIKTSPLTVKKQR